VTTTPPPPTPFAMGRTCGLDPGQARVGLAIDDELGLMAHPRGTLDGSDLAVLVKNLRDFADSEGVSRFVVGLPLGLRGDEGPSARKARHLAQRLADETGRAVELWDERFSTVQAERALRGAGVRGRMLRRRIDETAACAILQSWLDARRGTRKDG
jgi:putative Holliday junction resolvase